MALGREIKRRLQQVALPLLGACLTAYFVYHAIHGDRGIYAWLRINQELKIANAEATSLQGERQALERRITSLSSTSLDLDMLDERARVMLNFAHPDDLIIFYEQPIPTGG